MSEIYSGTVSQVNADCVRVEPVLDRGGEIVAPGQTIVLCHRLRELELEVGDVLRFEGQLTPGRGSFFAFRKLPPR